MTLCEEFKIDGNSVVAPDAGVSFKREDIEAQDSGQDESGTKHRYLMRSGVRRWGFQYTHLSRAEYEYMEGLISGKESFTFAFPSANGEESCTAYCASRSVAIQNILTGVYSNYTFEILEC